MEHICHRYIWQSLHSRCNEFESLARLHLDRSINQISFTLETLLDEYYPKLRAWKYFSIFVCLISLAPPHRRYDDMHNKKRAGQDQPQTWSNLSILEATPVKKLCLLTNPIFWGTSTKSVLSNLKKENSIFCDGGRLLLRNHIWCRLFASGQSQTRETAAAFFPQILNLKVLKIVPKHFCYFKKPDFASLHLP